MSKFKEGQKYRKVSGPVAIDGPKIGDEVTIKRTYSDYIDVEEFGSCTYDIEYFTEHFEPAEDRFKIEPGDYVEISGLTKEQIYEIIEAFEAAGGINKGDIDDSLPYLLFDCRDKEIWTRPDTDTNGARRQITVSDLIEDRTNWHPHHDVIVAWAKGAKIRGRRCGAKEWDEDMTFIGWRLDWEYEVMPEPDQSAEISEIEQEMRKLADRLEKLK